MELSLSWKKGTQRTFRRMLRILNDGSSTNRAEAAISKVLVPLFEKAAVAYGTQIPLAKFAR